ncbi:MAG: 1,2-phenylacetyl-CoA epoxidase, subunit A, partial [uncultured Gemmatimonadaceae bacterium]
GYHDDGDAGRPGPARPVRGAHRGRRVDRAEGLDARALPQAARAHDVAARALGDRRDAPRGELDHPRAEPAPQDVAARQGAGRGRPRALHLLRHGDARRVPRGARRRPPLGQGQVLEHLQLPHAHLGRRGGDRVVRRRRGDRQPDRARQALLVRPLRARDGARVQGGELPQEAGLREHRDARRRDARAAGDGAGRGEPVVVALAHDVRAERRRVAELGGAHAVGDQEVLERRAAAAVREPHGAAGAGGGAHPARPRAAPRRGHRRLAVRADRLGRVLGGGQGGRAVQPRAPRGAQRGARRGRLGARGGRGTRGQG